MTGAAITLLIGFIILTTGSLGVIGFNLSEEPYMDFAVSQAVIQVGGSSFLLALWLAWSGLVVGCVLRGACSRIALIGIAWAITISFLLIWCMAIYLGGIRRQWERLIQWVESAG